MQIGAITSYIDVAQLVLYAFWVFFGGLIYYLRQEDKREGYPLVGERSGRPALIEGFPPMPGPKSYLMPDGHVATIPNIRPEREIAALPLGNFPGAPLYPTGDPLVDAIGPASYADRMDRPDLGLEGLPKIVPLRVATDYFIEGQDPDPRGMEVIAADGQIAGVVRDVWVDRSEFIMRYLEVEPALPAAAGTVLVPSAMARISRNRRVVKVKSLIGEQFARVPGIKDPNQITLLEEDKVMAYFGGGHLYAMPSRAEPIL